MTTENPARNVAPEDVPQAGDVPVEPVEPDDAPAGRPRRRPIAVVITTFACLLVFFALVAPNQLDQLTPLAFVRIPVEALVGAAIMLVLPPKARRIVAAVLGVLLGLLVIVKLFNMGFYVALSKPFDPILDFSYLQPGINFLYGAAGKVGAPAIIVGVCVVAVGLVVLVTLAVMRLARIAAGRRTASTRVIAVLGVLWLVLALTGAQLDPGQPLAARTAAVLAYDNVRQVGVDINDEHQFQQQYSAPDPFAKTPSNQLLSALRGKNVLLVFVESYGRSAVQGSSFAPAIDKELDAGTQQLASAGFRSESAFLTSATFGGASWLAHSTLQSGLWIDNQSRYDTLLNLPRFNLSNAFQKAGWRTIGDDPSNITNLPKATLYDYNKFYDALNVGYRGPNFSYATMPDQYVLEAFQRNELSQAGHQPVMAELDLVSSHDPWTPLPKMVPWNQLGNGSIFDPMPAAGPQPAAILGSATKLRNAYGQSIQYTLSALISYLMTYGDKNTVMVFLGDHQPASLISQTTNHDVPISIVAKDPSVFSDISSWNWQPGLRPAPNAPVWPMSAFRSKFLSAFDAKDAR